MRKQRKRPLMLKQRKGDKGYGKSAGMIFCGFFFDTGLRAGWRLWVRGFEGFLRDGWI